MAVKQGNFYDNQETIHPRERHANLEKKLRAVISHAYRFAPAVRDIMDKAGIKPSDIRSYKDLDKLPVTRKNDLIQLQKLHPPYGGFLSIPPEEVERVFISPGPIYEPLHFSRIEWFARAFWAAGFRKGDVVVNTFTYHLSPAGILFHEALRHCGATVVVTGVGNTEIQLQAMRDLKATGFVGTPSFLMTIIKRVEELGLNFRKDFAVKKAWFTGEMLSSSVRKVLEGEYGINTAQAYAVTEPGGAIAYECEEKSGMHMMDEYFVEIVDPQTGKQLPPGEVGEIVVTPLYNKSWGLIRFGTGDLSSYTTEPCPCGRTAHKITGVLGRTGDAVKVRGMFVVAKQAEDAIMAQGAVSRFQIVVTRIENRDVLTLKAELNTQSVDHQIVVDDINKRFQNTCRVKIDVFELVPTGTLPEKYQKISDERKWD